MGDDSSTARRARVERNIYRRDNGVYEVGFRDGNKQTVEDSARRDHGCASRP
jgi:hypothetical protein